MREVRRSPLASWGAFILVVFSLGSGALGFFTEATYSFALVGSFFWLGIAILSALLAVALLLLDRPG